jgi:adenine-specific DNA-methyltransferase
MMKDRQKLELIWIGKENRPDVEPRILLEDPEESYHASHRVTDKDIFDNRLIFGDNLLALRALEQEFAGKIKCIFIDPPYNTGSAFTHYDDGIEHSIWLSLMQDRLNLLRGLLADNGVIWISIDDNECHYLKVLMDEIFGRRNFMTTICWEKVYTLKNSAKHFSAMHDFILVYAKDIERVSLSLLERGDKQNSGFKNPDNDTRGPWIDSAMHGRNFYSKGSYFVTSPSGKVFQPPPGRYWTVSEENFRRLDKDNRVWWGKKGANAPRKKTFVDEVRQGVVPGTIWLYKDAGQNAEAKNEIKTLFAADGEVFITPKPEKLLKQILTISSNPGDLVLDSFAGTGTTGAVAHKMGRRWIMVELGGHCHTHIIPRMKKVIDGADPGGITKAVGWKGGGGFRYFRLAPSLLEKDKWDNWVISKEYNAVMLASAMAKHEGFVYNPDETLYWKQGRSTEKDYIFTTTNFITIEYLDSIHEEMRPDESLLICCKSFQEACADRYENITIKKIPNMLLGRCEFGKDDYSLNVVDLTERELEMDGAEEMPIEKEQQLPRRKKAKEQQGLFDGEDE